MFRKVVVLLLLGIGLSAKGASLWESFKAPKLYPNITWQQLQKIHAEQISKMWIVRDGKEWIKVRDWKMYSPDGNAFLRELPAWRGIPKEYAVEIHREMAQGSLLARLLLKNETNAKSFMGVLYPPKGMEGTLKVGDAATLWLGERTSGILQGKDYYSAFDIYPAKVAQTYRPPMAREVALAMKNEGKTFMVKLPTVAEDCSRCGGKGILQREEEPMVGGGSASSVQRHGSGREGFLSIDSGAYQRAKERAARANQPRNFCPKCEGKGKIYEEEFRTLIFKKP